MGSWYQTCGVSRLPIRVGNHVVILILRQNDNISNIDITGDGFYNSETFCFPIFSPIRAIYNDYGDVKSIESNSFLEKEMNRIIFDKGLKLENIKDEVKAKSYYKLEDIYKIIVNGGLKGHSIVMIHEDLFNCLINEMGRRKLYNSEDLTYRNFLLKSAEHCDSLLKELKRLSYIKEYQENHRLLDCDIEKLNNYEDIKEKLEKHNIFYQKIFQPLNDFLDKSLKNQVINDFIFEENKKNLIKIFIELILIKDVFYKSRMFWFPQPGIGSQNDEYMIHKVISNDTIYKCNKRIEQLKTEDNSEDSILQETLFLPYNYEKNRDFC